MKWVQSKSFRHSLLTLVLLSFIGLTGCNRMQSEKELELKAKELALKEQELAQQQGAQINTDAKRAELKNDTLQANAERVVRQNAMVITQSGGPALLRALPTRNSAALGKLYDSERVVIVGETNNCDIVQNHKGCWVKINSSSGQGYFFDAYLQRY